MPSTASAINIYRTLVSGLFRRKDFGFVVRGKNLASISRFVAGIRHGRKLRSRINVDVTTPAGSMGSLDGSTSQLVQAMAGFGGGAADSSNAVPLAAEMSQPTFLTAPHA